jgi:tellurite resistance protein TerC
MISSAEWLYTIIGLSAIVTFDLTFAIVRRNKETSTKEAVGWTFFYIALATAFGLTSANLGLHSDAQRIFCRLAYRILTFSR